MEMIRKFLKMRILNKQTQEKRPSLILKKRMKIIQMMKEKGISFFVTQ